MHASASYHAHAFACLPWRHNTAMLPVSLLTYSWQEAHTRFVLLAEPSAVKAVKHHEEDRQSGWVEPTTVTVCIYAYVRVSWYVCGCWWVCMCSRNDIRWLTSPSTCVCHSYLPVHITNGGMHGIQRSCIHRPAWKVLSSLNLGNLCTRMPSAHSKAYSRIHTCIHTSSHSNTHIYTCRSNRLSSSCSQTRSLSKSTRALLPPRIRWRQKIWLDLASKNACLN